MYTEKVHRLLEKLGYQLKEDGKHTKVFKNGVRVSSVSRKNKLSPFEVKRIEKQIGEKLT